MLRAVDEFDKFPRLLLVSVQRWSFVAANEHELVRVSAQFFANRSADSPAVGCENQSGRQRSMRFSSASCTERRPAWPGVPGPTTVLRGDTFLLTQCPPCRPWIFSF